MYAHPSQLRAANRRRVFRLLLARGTLSRAELARATGLSAMTTGKAVDDLVADGLAEECEPVAASGTPAAMGRPPRNVRLARAWEMPAIELGVRETIVAAQPLACDREPRVVRFPTPATAADLLRAVGVAQRSLSITPRGFVAVSVPGVLDAESGTILCSPNLRMIEEPGLLDKLGKGWGKQRGGRVCAVQEIQALAMGHQAAGDAPDSFVLVDFGDGVGGAVVAGGQLFQGSLPMSGELGHTGVHGNTRRCTCGAVGCVETLVSRSGLLRSFREHSRRGRATWAMVAEHVAEAGVEAWLARAIDAAAVVIAGAINLVGTQDVVLMGDLPNLHRDVGEAFQQRIQLHSLIGRFGRLSCTVAPQRRGLGLVAAAADRVLLAGPELVAPADETQRTSRSRRG